MNLYSNFIECVLCMKKGKTCLLFFCFSFQIYYFRDIPVFCSSVCYFPPFQYNFSIMAFVFYSLYSFMLQVFSGCSCNIRNHYSSLSLNAPGNLLDKQVRICLKKQKKGEIDIQMKSIEEEEDEEANKKT